MPAPIVTAEAVVIKTLGKGKKAPSTLERASIPVPAPKEHQLLVRVSYAAQNPTDIQSLDAKAFNDGRILGCDFAGTVEEVGPDATRFKKGDTIAALVWGGENPGVGAFAQYTLADDRIAFAVPDNVPLEEAATIPLGALTALLVLFSHDCLDIDKDAKVQEPILIWGGTSSVGLYAIQLAAMHGLEVITTCSPAHHDLVKSLGAKHVFDYRDENVVSKIRKTAPFLRYIFDNIGNETSSITASKAAGFNGGTLCTVRPGKEFTEDVAEDVKVTAVLVFTVFPKEHIYRNIVFPLKKSDHALAADFCTKLPKLLAEGTIKPNKAKVLGGLDDIEKGFQEYRDEKISNYKLVYKIQD